MLRLTKEMKAFNFLDMGIETENPLNLQNEIKTESENDPAVFTSLSKVLGIPEDDADIYFLSTKSMKYGAKAILYPNVVEKIADKFHGDFYILPSSIHELLIYEGGKGANNEYLVNMVREINSTQVAPEEQLSDNVYHYHDGDFEIIK